MNAGPPATATSSASPGGSLSGRHLGEGAPLLLLHGLGASHIVWRDLFGHLVDRFEIDVPDLPGFGRSQPLDRPHSPPALADAVEAHLDALGWDSAHVAGNSLGGLVALELGRRGRARTVTALSPAGMAQGWEDVYARNLLRGQARLGPLLRSAVPTLARSAAGRTVLLSSATARPWQVDPVWATNVTLGFFDAPAVEDALDAFDEEDTTENLHRIEVPVTVAWGTRDRLLFPWQGQRFARALPDVRLVRLPGLGHQPMSDDPAMVAHVIERTAARAGG